MMDHGGRAHIWDERQTAMNILISLQADKARLANVLGYAHPAVGKASEQVSQQKQGSNHATNAVRVRLPAA